jgi:rhodanese-related sulfurtransferase/uncharacterized membrane protein YedE/YeeE
VADLPVIATALPIGIAFGVVLERAGLGDAKVIRGQLVGRDFTVILVMFGAIVTAMLGMLWVDALGIVPASGVASPPTDLAAQAVGAVIFGGGFGIAALCPGTACVAAASGRRDGLAAVAGVFAGTMLTPVVWPSLGRVVSEVPGERRFLPDDLGLPTWAVATGLVLFAMAAVRIARARQAGPRPAWWRPSAIEAVGLTMALGYAAVEGRPSINAATLAGLAATIEREEDHVDALDLATWIHDRKEGLHVIDVREGLDSTTYMIPGARAVSLGALRHLDVPRDDVVVLYSDGGAHAAQGWVLLQLAGYRRALVLKDGMAAWEDDVLSPLLGPVTDDASREHQARVRALSLWFGGRPRAGDAPFTQATSDPVARRRRRTC